MHVGEQDQGETGDPPEEDEGVAVLQEVGRDRQAAHRRATKYSATLCEIACSITCRCQGMASALACGVGVGVGAGFWRYAVMPLCR